MPSHAASRGFDTLRDELLSDQDPRIQCKMCRWIETLKPEVRAEWIAAIIDYSYTASSLMRALARRKVVDLPRNSVEHCRRSEHHGAALNRPPRRPRRS